MRDAAPRSARSCGPYCDRMDLALSKVLVVAEGSLIENVSGKITVINAIGTLTSPFHSGTPD